MTGAELFEALSFVDEKYIQEAETARLGRNTPWMKVLSVAACLCILITGVYAFSRMQTKGAMESISEAAAPEAAMEAVPAATEAAPTEEFRAEGSAAEKEDYSAAAGELEQIPFVRLRITEVLEDGSFAATVEAVGEDPTSMETGMELTVVIDPAKMSGGTAEIQNDLSQITENISVVVENGAYDAGANTLYAAQLFLVR